LTPIDGKIIQLPFSIDLESWRSYHHHLCEEYPESKWTWDKGVEELDVREAIAKCTNSQERSVQGWMLQTNRIDDGEPSVMSNSNVRPLKKYKELGLPLWSWRIDLPLGPVEGLAQAVPSVYRWTVYEMPANGIVPTHIDYDENVLLIPLYWPKGQQFLLEVDGEWQDWSDIFVADGRVLLLDGHTAHWSCNNSDMTRVNIMARIPREDLEQICSVKGVF
jgi:hypothetical protein